MSHEYQSASPSTSAPPSVDDSQQPYPTIVKVEAVDISSDGESSSVSQPAFPERTENPSVAADAEVSG